MNCKIRCQLLDKSIQSYLMMNPAIAQFYRLNLTFKAQPPYHETIVIGSKAFNSWKRDIWVLMVIVTCLSWWDFGTWWGVTHGSWCLCGQKICPSSHSSDTFEVINIKILYISTQTPSDTLGPWSCPCRVFGRRLFKHGYSDIRVSNLSSWLPRSLLRLATYL